MSDIEARNPFSDIFDAPRSSRNIPMRPLNRGMIRTISPQMLPEGSFYTVNGYMVTQNGLQRRPGWSISGDGEELDFSNGVIWDLVTYINGSTLETLAITQTDLWRFTFRNGFSSITGGDGCFNGSKVYNIDWTIVPTINGYSVVFADAYNYLQHYDGTEVQQFSDYAESPKTVEYFENRLYVGSPDEDHPNRIIWTNLGDSTDFDVSNYLDFLEEQDEIVSIKGLGNLLVVYFPKAIYFGRPTNRVDLPFAFTKMETGNIGLVGRKAVTSWDDGHFFIGQDDVYFFSASSSLQPLNCPVVDEMIFNATRLDRSYVVSDPLNEQVIFAIPGAGSNIERLWYFNYKTKAWSYSDVDASMIASVGTYVSRTWGGDSDTMVLNDVTLEAWNDDTDTEDDFETAGFTTWKSMESSLSLKEVFIAWDNALFRFEELEKRDHFGPIETEIESGDFDLGIPDVNKCMNRLSMKVNKIMDDPIIFDVWVSNKRGHDYSEDYAYKGRLRIEANEDEGKIDFRSYGSTFRFKLVSVSETDQYTINEIVLRGRARGLEV